MTWQASNQVAVKKRRSAYTCLYGIYIYYIYIYISLNITAFHMTGWHEIVQTFIPRHFLLHGNMVHGIVSVHCSELLAGSIPLTWCFLARSWTLLSIWCTTSHCLGNQNRKKRLIPTGRTGESSHQTKPTSWTKTPELDPTRKTQKQICSALYSTWHDRPWKAVIDGGRWGFCGQLQIWISIIFLQKNAFSKGVFLVNKFCTRDLYSLKRWSTPTAYARQGAWIEIERCVECEYHQYCTSHSEAPASAGIQPKHGKQRMFPQKE